MADPSLNNPVVIQATRLDASILPRNVFSKSYLLYVIAQGTDVGAIAGKANEAGQGAYDAQVKNDEQDVELADHEARIQQLRIDVDNHEIRITANTNAIAALDVRLTTAEGEIVTLQADVSALDGRVTTAENNISALQADYVSKTDTTSQSLASPLNVTTSYSVGGKKVVGARQTGWTAATGTANKGAFNADLTFAVSDTYTQSEIQAIANSLIAERRRTKALEDALRAHGLID
ncbi:phage tail protein [Salmonella enterica]|uniref:Phage tail protein n=1 Tax=Salmonella enterica TaxID=28901 RepID=A0A747SQJ8_SALER|nr:phage tail protein [Salmonella enterica]EBM8011411.1 phage tail protein [Salmonella enterica subsp. enterica serovar Brandenburg]EBP4232636.1 phage tail protein [Salmonella enterica subsp. enterica]EBQ5950395.1 phage tail protein [Salmonella enterica subsp. enterica serovar Panama]ECB1141679.1 phage tail protein [Salmonella enterica subsp. enterica serovar Saphra]ECE8176024.1 phage tail protein [Salmonella enterica subsp. enterica serovar Urbana]HAE6773765.1 phage tail protein [Salmonella 